MARRAICDGTGWMRLSGSVKLRCARSGGPLKDIRDNSENAMARVQAVKAMEQIAADEQDGRRQSALPSPGLVVIINSDSDRRVIEHGGPAMPAIEHRVNERQEEQSHG